MVKHIVIEIWNGEVQNYHGIEGDVEIHILDWDIPSRDMLVNAGLSRDEADQLIDNNSDAIAAVDKLFKEWEVSA